MKKLLIMLAAMLPLFAFVGCGEDEENHVDTNLVSLYVDDTYQIPMDIIPSSVASENEFIATIENDGVITGMHVGETNVSIDGRYTIPVEVKGKYNLFDDPVTEWGCSSAYIKENQKQGTYYIGDGENDDSEMIEYRACGEADWVIYLLDDDKLQAVGVIIPSFFASEVGGFLAERFFMIPYDLGNYTIGGANAYNTNKATTFVYVQVSSIEYLTILYMQHEADANNLRSGDMPITKKLESIIQKKLQ